MRIADSASSCGAKPLASISACWVALNHRSQRSGRRWHHAAPGLDQAVGC